MGMHFTIWMHKTPARWTVLSADWTRSSDSRCARRHRPMSVYVELQILFARCRSSTYVTARRLSAALQLNMIIISSILKYIKNHWTLNHLNVRISPTSTFNLHSTEDGTLRLSHDAVMWGLSTNRQHCPNATRQAASLLSNFCCSK